jgi:RNA polymerase sigma-70 factor, ECF subfamily
MLADEVRLELVARTRMSGRSEVGTYLGNYASTHDWRFMAGFVDGRPAAIACEPGLPSGRPIYFVMLDWRDGEVLSIRDFRYARYVCDSAELTLLDR